MRLKHARIGSGTSPGRTLAAALVVLALATLACDPSALGLGGGNLPTVTILSPATGGNVPVNTLVTVQVSASDSGGAGVVRVDLQVDDIVVDTFEAGGPQPTLTADLTFTPTAEGAITVEAVAFRQDGTASDPATIALSVVGAATGESGGPPPPVETPSGGVRVQAQARLDVPIRERPGPGCPQIGVWKEGDTGDFLIRTTSPTEWWYQTDYLGPTTIGYVYQGQEGLNFTLLEDDSVLPREPEQGCLYCGDGVCSPEVGEACDVCVPDCGVCPFCGDGVVNQDSEECDSGGCASGYFCNTSCACEREPAVCGNGVVEEGEECDVTGCPVTAPYFCNTNCQCELPPFCGDGICNETDLCSCEADCGPC